MYPPEKLHRREAKSGVDIIYGKPIYKIYRYIHRLELFSRSRFEMVVVYRANSWGEIAPPPTQKPANLINKY
jgi:hypothetical protein